MVNTRHPRQYQAYYTKSVPIQQYMVERLHLQPGQYLLEPCAGDGDFIEAILRVFSDLNIEAFELNPQSVHVLINKFKDLPNVSITEADALVSEALSFNASFSGGFDAVIANPPYGGWAELSQRQALKRQFGGVYAKETYGLFLHRCLDLLRPGGRLVFIIPDTWLHLHRHQKLREVLLFNTQIEEIALFPSYFFPGVNFGYAGLSILTLQRNRTSNPELEGEIIIRRGFKEPNDLITLPSHISNTILKQKHVLSNPSFAFLTSPDSYPGEGIHTLQTLSDIADCVTGFYSGNDREHLRCINKSVRGSTKYNVVNQDNIWQAPYSPSLTGVEGEQYFIPVVKGGSTRFHKHDNWYMDWSRETVQKYLADKKARFQNSKYYFREGIAVPMVSATNVTACLLKNRLFDQSIVGIFPHDEVNLLFLLAFFNSKLATNLVRALNPSANNSSNYLKKIPIVLPNEIQRHAINLLTLQLIEQAYIGEKIEDSQLSWT